MKTAVITGAAQGVGSVTAELFARRGYRVVLCDIQALDEGVARLRGAGFAADGLTGDVSSETFVLELARWVERECGAAEVLVNNAGISLIMPAEQTTAAQWQQVMNVNLFGPFLLCKFLGAQMLARRTGSIVNVASVALQA